MSPFPPPDRDYSSPLGPERTGVSVSSHDGSNFWVYLVLVIVAIGLALLWSVCAC